jgi:hypothetical protein
MAKLNREAYLCYLDTAFKKKVADVSTSTFEVIGTDIEEMTFDLSPDTERIKNILGQTKTRDNGYEASMESDPFYADPDSALYAKLKEIAFERKKGDDCKTLLLEVIVDDDTETTYEAYLREVMVKVNSIGGDTTGVNFPFTVSEDGAMVKGTVTKASVEAGSPVFTATP